MRRIDTIVAILACWVLVSCGSTTTPPAADSPPNQFYVATSGSDKNSGTLERPFRTIQHALDVAAAPGDEIFVRSGTYAEAISFPADGAPEHPIVLQNYPGERPAIVGSGNAQELVRIFDRRYVSFVGFDVGNLSATSPSASGAIMVEGYGSHIRVANNLVHDVAPKAHRYANGRAINVRGFYAARPIGDVEVWNNTIVRCVVVDGNVLEISGNATGIDVSGNRMRSNGGIALNVTGGTQPPSYRRWNLQVRNVRVSRNIVTDSLGAGAIGIYIQASENVRVENNVSERNAWGMILDSEYPQVHVRNVTISRNLVRDNPEAGIMVGSPFFPTTVFSVVAENNVVSSNGAGENGNGGNFGIGHAVGVAVHGNHLLATDRNALVTFGTPYEKVTLDGNCYNAAGNDAARAYFGYGAKTYVGFSTYQAATHQDRHSTFGKSCLTAALDP